ncbi:hypothetical protein [Xanthomonas citri]|uniref:hypothetical protein n=1 Tax=Xanthomonas citri TaxID=346 RepID=UPI00031D53F9|nr:hypothetical protein [Xanthomonas citri]AMV00057.1 hypothetical protein TP37_19735 [Xanthomonas citri pv. aurantifolii]AMV02115.1 hypothetical protein TP50_06400 [Xanthomonas citri pv. aurantifolii]MCC8492148.1 hypothetical protein [Xanthomonas citri pv. fuscans]TBW92949.1 hypothetical protein TP49_23610 [Xanthomonas citri pv. aurantifolii]TBX01147.1 hypothetical protein TP47_00930 [Xanthomonas citri pv. aurantifolii]
MSGPHIHTPDDGRGRRQVLVDGRTVKRVVYADTRRGLVRYHNDPPKVHKHGKRFIERTRRGAVEVLPL